MFGVDHCHCESFPLKMDQEQKRCSKLIIWEPFHQVSLTFTFLYPGLEFILRYLALTRVVKKLSPTGL